MRFKQKKGAKKYTYDYDFDNLVQLNRYNLKKSSFYFIYSKYASAIVK